MFADKFRQAFFDVGDLLVDVQRGHCTIVRVPLYRKLRRKKQLRIGLDDSTYLALRRAAKRAHTPKEEFVRDAIVRLFEKSSMNRSV